MDVGSPSGRQIGSLNPLVFQKRHIFEGDAIDELALKNLVCAAVVYNQIKLKKKKVLAGTPARAHKIRDT